MSKLISFDDRVNTLRSFSDAFMGYACEFAENTEDKTDHSSDVLEKINYSLTCANSAAKSINEAYDLILSSLQKKVSADLPHNTPPLFEKVESHIDAIIKELDGLDKHTKDPVLALYLLCGLCKIRDALFEAADCSVDFNEPLFNAITEEV